MIVETIDLYGYFNFPRSSKTGGYLDVMCHSPSNEIGIDRLRPAMLVLPGGAYVFCSEREGEPIALEYIRHGFNAFVLRYSLAPDFIYPTQLREAAMAMIFIRENAAKYNVDVNNVAAVGFSAGGHLCGCLGTMFAAKELSDLGRTHLIRPDAVILSYPVSVYADQTRSHVQSFKNVTGDNEQLSEKLSLEKCICANSSPAFIWHTVADDCVPVYGSIVLATAYDKNKVPFELHLFEQGCHGLATCTKEVNTVNESASKWIELSINWLKVRGFTIYS